MTLLIGFGAVNTGNNLLYLLVSALLGFMAVSGILGKNNIDGLSVGIDLPDEIYAGHETLATLHVANRRRRLPAFLLKVSLLDREAVLPVVPRRGAASTPLPLVFRGRGRQTTGAARLCSIFPINFFVRSRSLNLGAETVVFPAPRTCRYLGSSGRRQRWGQQQLPQKGYDGDLDRISNYRGSEPLKLIHWKLSARHDQLMVKELSAAGVEPVILVPADMPGADLEERLGCAAYLVNRYTQNGRPVGLRLGSRLIPPAVGRNHKLLLLRELATYGQD